MGIAALLLVASCSIWVYLDASSNKIGDISSFRRDFRFSASAWAIGILFLWPVAFPYYLRIRDRLIKAAVDHPVEDNLRVYKLAGLTLLSIGLIAASLALPILPTTNDLATTSFITGVDDTK